MHLKDELMPRYAELIYNGFWFSPEREMLQAAIDKSQEKVEGRVRLKLYKGSAPVVGRQSPNSLYSLDTSPSRKTRFTTSAMPRALSGCRHCASASPRSGI